MPIPNNVINRDKDVFFTERFKTLVRSEKEYLIKTAQVQAILEPQIIWAFRNDFYRVLRYHNIESHLWWATAFINDRTNPADSVVGMTSFLVISESDLSAAIARSNTVRG